MTRKEQFEFVTSITNALQFDLIKKLEANKIPENWNGFELRQWVADYYAATFLDTSKLTGKRKKEYKNDLLINNLY